MQKRSTPLLFAPGSSYVQNKAKGTILVLAPWNFPFCLNIQPLISAIAGGNTVVMKPSEVASHTAQMVEDIVVQFVDQRVCRVVQGAIPETTALLKEQWDHIFYTGNGTVGKVVLQAASKYLTPCTLELGGKVRDIHLSSHCSPQSTLTSRVIWRWLLRGCCGASVRMGRVVVPGCLFVQSSTCHSLFRFCSTLVSITSFVPYLHTYPFLHIPCHFLYSYS